MEVEEQKKKKKRKEKKEKKKRKDFCLFVTLAKIVHHNMKSQKALDTLAGLVRAALPLM